MNPILLMHARRIADERNISEEEALAIAEAMFPKLAAKAEPVEAQPSDDA